MPTKDPFFLQGEVKDIKDKTIKRHTQGNWIDDSLPGDSDEKNYLSLVFDFRKLKWFLYFTIAMFLLMVVRIGYLQIARGDEYRAAAEQNRVRIVSQKAPRGIIYDRNNTMLVHNIPNFYLEIIPADLPENQGTLNSITNRVSEILEINPDELTTLMNSAPKFSYQPYLIKEHIDYNKALLLNIESTGWPGFNLKTSAIRKYTTSPSISHILGYTGKISPEELEIYTQDNTKYSFDDYIGKTGIEYQYEEELKGLNGKKQIEVDSLGKESKIITEEDSQPGNNIILTIDFELQEKLSELLENKVNNPESITGAAAVAINPNTGEILALVSSPLYDNNTFARGIKSEEYQSLLEDPKKPLFNRAISGEYPSGSTIKPLIAAAALQENIINSQTTFNSTGGIQIDKWFFPDWKAGGHGSTDVIKAIAESVNTFFYTIGGGYDKFTGLGVDRIKYYAQLFGLNDKLGIDIPAEASGFLPTKEWKVEVKGERWYIGDTYHLAIGQGDLLVTPLQIATYTAAIANGGTLYQPHLVKEITDSHNNSTKKIQPKIIRSNFINSQHIQTVQQGLRQSVLSGSSRLLGDLPFTTAGKTGTAQFGNQEKTHAWYSGYAPYKNPEIVVTVLVEAGGEGHAVALPIAKEALKQWFSH